MTMASMAGTSSMRQGTAALVHERCKRDQWKILTRYASGSSPLGWRTAMRERRVEQDARPAHALMGGWELDEVARMPILFSQ